jgi:hypothetical protein
MFRAAMIRGARRAASPRAAAASLALALAACTPAQAPAMRTSGKLMALGGVAGIVGAAFATSVTDSADDMLIGFEVVSALGILTYAYAELTWPRVRYIQETTEERNRRWAKILTERAGGAAREGRCARVRRLEVRVQKYDRVIHDLVFMKDAEILKCLEAGPPSLESPSSDAPSSDAPAPPAPPPLEAPSPDAPVSPALPALPSDAPAPP